MITIAVFLRKMLAILTFPMILWKRCVRAFFKLEITCSRFICTSFFHIFLFRKILNIDTAVADAKNITPATFVILSYSIMLFSQVSHKPKESKNTQKTWVSRYAMNAKAQSRTRNLTLWSILYLSSKDFLRSQINYKVRFGKYISFSLNQDIWKPSASCSVAFSTIHMLFR